MSTSLIAIKAQNQSRLVEEKRIIDLKRNAMILVLNHCIENGYVETVEKLIQEAGVSLSKFEVADNIGLIHIIQEYETYYEMKFGKKPKLVRRIDNEVAGATDAKKIAADRRKKRNNYTSSHMPEEARIENNIAVKSVVNASSRNCGSKAVNSSSKVEVSLVSEEPSLGLVGQKVTSTKSSNHVQLSNNEIEDFEERLMKPLPSFGDDPDMKALASTITREIYQRNPNVHWDDVVELEDAKRLLKEAVVAPIRYPQLFTGLLTPWCGILLFGPPGTGKTMLAKAVATECHTTFFNISASSIISKYRGDSEKLVRMLFELARYHAPSTIFLDEIDSIMGQRGGDGGQEHEASRRMKTELLIQMDGLSKCDSLVFVLAASNLPWELDVAMLRRLEKRVLVPLPGPTARRKMVEKLLRPYPSTDINFDDVVAITEGFSGSDIKLLVKEAAMGPVRRLMSRLESVEVEEEEASTNDATDICALLEPMTSKDMREALEKTKPSAYRFAEKYEEWQRDYGST